MGFRDFVCLWSPAEPLHMALSNPDVGGSGPPLTLWGRNFFLEESYFLSSLLSLHQNIPTKP